MIVRSFLTIFSALLAITSPCSQAAVGAADISRVAGEQLQRHNRELQARYGDNVRIQSSVDRIDNRLSMADCDIPLTAELTSQREIGRVNIQVRCDGSNTWTLYVPAEVNIFQSIVVLTEPVGRGAVLRADQLTLREVDISQLHGGFYTRIDDVVGLVSKRLLSTGKPLLESLLEPPVVVHRGDAVVVTAASNGLTVKMPGVALADGQAGQQISVRNTQSDRVVEAEVTGPGQVRVTM